jgi:hypothetical protein
MEKKIEDIKRESKRKKASGLDEREADNEARLAFGYRPNKDRRDGGKRGRRKTDREPEGLLPLLDRVQESGEVQGSLWGAGPSDYTFENGTSPRDKDESS